MKASWLRHAFSVLIVLGLVLAGFKYLDLDLMVEAWRQFSWKALGGLLVLPALYLGLKSWRFYLLMRSAQPDISASTVMKGYAASQSASLLPAGFAARSMILTQAGVPVERSMSPVLANSAIDQLTLLVGGLILGIWYESVREASSILALVLALLVLVVWFRGSRAWLGARLRRIGRKIGQEKKIEEFLEACWSLVNPRLFLSVFLLSVVADLMSYLTLVLVVVALGLKVQLGALAAAFLIPTLLGRMSPLPAGAGVTEAGMIALMANHGGMTIHQAAAATTLMRGIDVVLPALYGAAIYLFGWRAQPSASTAPVS